MNDTQGKSDPVVDSQVRILKALHAELTTFLHRNPGNQKEHVCAAVWHWTKVMKAEDRSLVLGQWTSKHCLRYEKRSRDMARSEEAGSRQRDT